MSHRKKIYQSQRKRKVRAISAMTLKLREKI